MHLSGKSCMMGLLAYKASTVLSTKNIYIVDTKRKAHCNNNVGFLCTVTVELKEGHTVTTMLDSYAL